MKIVKFILDMIVAYLFAVIFLIPGVNVLMLRTLMNDSKDFKKVKKKYG